MRGLRSRTAQCVLPTLVLLLGSEAFAFEISTSSSGAELFRSPGRWSFAVANTESATVAQSIRLSADVWATALGGQLRARWLGVVASDASDDVDTVSFEPAWNRRWGDPQGALAYADVRFDPTSGRIRQSDVRLNTEVFMFGEEPGQFDLQSVVIHELGHGLGLAHSCGDSGTTYPSCFNLPPEEADDLLSAVMAPGLAPSERRRVLNRDDRAGLTALFPGERAQAPDAPQVELRCDIDRIEVIGSGMARVRRFRLGVAAEPGMLVNQVFFPSDLDRVSELVVEDPDTGAYVVTPLNDIPQCPVVEPEAEGGCRSVPESSSILFVLLGLAAFRWTRRV